MIGVGIGTITLAIRCSSVLASKPEGRREDVSASNLIYNAMRRLLRLALGFYFRRIECFHPERVPVSGPVLLTSNHPNSLTDSFLIGPSVSRKVNFVATVQLFRFKPLKALLTRCGVIPINRVKDNPKAMRSVRYRPFSGPRNLTRNNRSTGPIWRRPARQRKPGDIQHDSPPPRGRPVTEPKTTRRSSAKRLPIHART